MANLLRPLSWLLAAVGLLNLAKDLSYIEISQKLLAWSDAYQQFAAKVASLAFGWLRLFSLSITTEEMHVLVVAAILASATARAGHLENRRAGATKNHGPVFYFISTFFSPFIILALFDKAGATIAALGVTIALGVGIAISANDDPDPKLVRAELVGVIDQAHKQSELPALSGVQ